MRIRYPCQKDSLANRIRVSQSYTVDFKSTLLEPLTFKARVVQLASWRKPIVDAKNRDNSRLHGCVFYGLRRGRRRKPPSLVRLMLSNFMITSPLEFPPAFQNSHWSAPCDLAATDLPIFAVSGAAYSLYCFRVNTSNPPATKSFSAERPDLPCCKPVFNLEVIDDQAMGERALLSAVAHTGPRKNITRSISRS